MAISGGTIRTPMTIRSSAVRLVIFALASTLSWSLWASCVEGAMFTPSAQMACCKNGHHTCGHLGTSEDCCQTAPQASQFTVVGKTTPPIPTLVVADAFGSVPMTLPAPWHPRPRSATWSPPGTKHPMYLRLSTLRL